MQPDTRAVAAFLARVRVRLAWRFAAEGAAIGFMVASALVLAIRPSPVELIRTAALGLGVVIAGAVLRILMARDRRRNVALLVEERAPQSRNLVFTASELGLGGAVSEPIAALVHDRAARLVSGLDATALFPVGRPFIALAALAAIWGGALAWSATRDAVPARRVSSSAVAAIDGVEIVITPPAYARRRPEEFRDPARIEALAGSRVRLTVRANAAWVVVETVGSRDTLSAPVDGAFSKELMLASDGYVALEPSSVSGEPGVRRLIGITVVPDAPPSVRITAPGKDVVFSDAHHTVDLVAGATDDIGVATLAVRYTRVAGSGERFTFKEGEVPIRIARARDTTWSATARWRLDDLGLEPGDLLVYRAVATDRRPGAVPAESDAFIIEILAPGGGAAAGFSIDPEQERYAVSQQMVILKTERLAARRSSLSADDYTAAAQDLAAEQRKVRAEFVFMMGGELADAPDPGGDINSLNEAAEAEGEDDLLAGRSANRGRVALVRAIRAMSRASASLTIADLAPALVHERAALTQLEAAFSHSRILLRALSQRERLDLTRRLSGELTDASRDVRPLSEPEADARAGALRRVLATIGELAAGPRLDLRASSRASALAEAVLRVDPSSAPLHAISAMLDSAAVASGKGREDDARTALDHAATAIVAALRDDVQLGPRVAPSLDRARVGGRLRDALRDQRRAGARPR